MFKFVSTALVSANLKAVLVVAVAVSAVHMIQLQTIGKYKYHHLKTHNYKNGGLSLADHIEFELWAKFSESISTILATPCSICLLYTSPSPRDKRQSRMPSSA